MTQQSARHPDLIIGGLRLPMMSGAESLTQDYEPLGGESLFRASDGSGLMLRTWMKTRIMTGGQGTIPAALLTLDYARTVELACVQPRAHRGNSPLPPCRSDAPPWRVSIMPDGLVSDGDVSGAAETLILYFPLFRVWLLRPTETFDQHNAAWSWQLAAEEA